MALGSGTISASAIRTELGLTGAISLGGGNVANASNTKTRKLARRLNSTDSISFSQFRNQSKTYTVDVFGVAGGGSGGYNVGGGGGAGSQHTWTSLPAEIDVTWSIVIGGGGTGDGGSGWPSGVPAESLPGGGGGGGGFGGTAEDGTGGGSGGGGGGTSSGSTVGGSGVTNQGHYGGAGIQYAGGGGGGAGAQGTDGAAGPAGGIGGYGIAVWGNNYAAGGGGGVDRSGDYGGDSGTPVIGGKGGSQTVSPTNGTAETGSGGGGGRYGSSGNGGGGVLIYRYLGAQRTTTGVSTYTDGTYTYHKFNTSATLTG